MKRTLERALAHVKRVRQNFSMTVAAGEIGVGRDTLLRFIRGEITPQQAALGAMARWERLNAAPSAQTQAAGVKPSDYMLNVRVHAGQQLCGVPLARLKDFATLIQLGELDDNMSIQVRNGLTRVLKPMDEQDTQWAVEMSLLSGDCSLVCSATSPSAISTPQPTLQRDHSEINAALPSALVSFISSLPSLHSLNPSLQTCAFASSLYPRRMTASIPKTATPVTAWATSPPSYWGW